MMFWLSLVVIVLAIVFFVGDKVREGFQAKRPTPKRPTFSSAKLGKSIDQKKVLPIVKSVAGDRTSEANKLPLCEKICPKPCDPTTNDCRDTACLRNFRESSCKQDFGIRCAIADGQTKLALPIDGKDVYQCPNETWGPNVVCELGRATRSSAIQKCNACSTENPIFKSVRSGTWGSNNSYTYTCQSGLVSALASGSTVSCNKQTGKWMDGVAEVTQEVCKQGWGDPLELVFDFSKLAAATTNVTITLPFTVMYATPVTEQVVKVVWGSEEQLFASGAVISKSFMKASITTPLTVKVYLKSIAQTPTAISFGANGWGNGAGLTAINSFGSILFTSLSYACSSKFITSVPAQVPNTVTSMSSMFNGASVFNQDISGWDVNKVSSMSAMFQNATAFNNGGVGLSWGDKTKKVLEMSFMFNGASVFNQDISGWDVTNVMNMATMFQNALAFNNGGVGLSWGDKTKKVLDMYSMFNGASKFNQDISTWNVGIVRVMINMFLNASNFNQDISTWNVGSVTEMTNMFMNASKFNQDISKWNVENVTGMAGMFSGATMFNQDISGWNVSKVSNMSGMFSGASVFNQNIGKWNMERSINSSPILFALLDNCGMSAENYSATLIGWAAQNVKPGVQLGAAGRQYTAAAAGARKTLTDPVASGGKGWIIIGDSAALETLSVGFVDGFFGNSTANNAVSNVMRLSTANLTNFRFNQTSTDPNNFMSQGNDIPGFITFTDAAGTNQMINVSLKWRAPPGNNPTCLVFQPKPSESKTVALSTSQYTLDPTKYIGLIMNGKTLNFSEQGSVTGNAATSGLLDLLNNYYATQKSA